MAPSDRGKLALVLCAAAVVYAGLSRLVLQGCPFSGDEYSMVLQAEGFARGVLKAPAPPFADWAPVDHVVIDDFVRSKYPPGTAALLALGVRAGVPWLVTPLVALLALVVTWFAVRAALDERRAFLTVAFLAAMPLYCYQAGTFLSHPATLLYTALGTYAAVRWAGGGGDHFLVLYGVAVGCDFLTRPLDAVLLGLALAALGSLRALVLAGASSLPFVAASFWYNKLQYGSLFTDGYQAYMPAFAKVYGASGSARNLSPLNLVAPLQIFHHLAVIETLLAQWTVPGSALIACLGWVALGREQAAADSGPAGSRAPAVALRRLSGALVVLFFGALLLTYAEPDDAPRPRYLSVVLLPLSLLAAAGWSRASELVRAQLGRHATWVVGLAMWMAPAFLIGSYLEKRVPEIEVHTGLGRELARQGIDAGVVILRAEWPTRYARNGMFFDRRPVLLSVGAQVSVDEVAARFPGQPVYEAFEPHGANPWKHGWVIRRAR